MSYLINRTPPARLRCLHYLLRFIKAKNGFNLFKMSEVTFDPEELNIKTYCEQLIRNDNLNISYCPFLENPLSKVGCYLTRQKENDSTKMKEISNTLNSLDGLGFLTRSSEGFVLTQEGSDFSEMNSDSEDWRNCIRQAILRYGPMVGLVHQILKPTGHTFSINQLEVGYPLTEESILIDNDYIEIPIGSQRDSNTRTKSCLLAWAVTAGFIIPHSLDGKIDPEKSHIQTLDFINSNSRNESSYAVSNIPDIFNGDFIVERPLDYNNLIKNVKALRENGQELPRQQVMALSHKIMNRRFAIVYLLNEAFTQRKNLSFEKMANLLLRHESFVIDESDFVRVMKLELNISFACGIPFNLTEEGNLSPQVGLNKEVLIAGSPVEIIDYLDGILSEVLI